LPRKYSWGRLTYKWFIGDRADVYEVLRHTHEPLPVTELECPYGLIVPQPKLEHKVSSLQKLKQKLKK